MKLEHALSRRRSGGVLAAGSSGDALVATKTSSPNGWPQGRAARTPPELPATGRRRYNSMPPTASFRLSAVKRTGTEPKYF